ncbi:MAG: thioredoxin family protein [Deltaproteobacteria bacterium]|nr:thioredoxin family protein [Deltaproteobacteria bacterium]MBW1812304.1 thioredoxin family protein [Deltaproteobacteria bacterium]MBW1846482.1 thioredoxin family protein [Deltaproteobacteria bacterium]MBW2180344.1 thioredoxin family protein [Deltaproteobacteria bacterium]MBW2365844.1 thioredoxin family protein [Deltaproteobacteria bacterium]
MESEVSQIKIGTFKVGIIGLKSALEQIAQTHSEKSDKEVANKLLDLLSAKNYIPDHVRESYGQAFVREFRKLVGQTYEEDNNRGLEIKVLGQGCAQCDRLEKHIMEVLSEMGLPADLEHVRDIQEIAKYKVMGVPALIINGEVMCKGKVPSKKQLKKWLEKTAEKR